MNGTRQKLPTATQPPNRPIDELEAASQRAQRKRKIFSIIVLAPLVAGLLGTSVYTFAPLVDPDSQFQGQQVAEASKKADQAGQIAALEAAIGRNPKDYPALVSLGNVYYDQSRYPEAESAYKRALAVDGTNPNVRVDYGTTLFYQDRILAAIQEYQTVLKSHPTHVNAKINLGVAYQALNQPEKATGAWTEALALTTDPDLQQHIKDLIAKVAKGG